jgi:hypothetical protein
MSHGREGIVDKQNETVRATMGTNNDESWKRGGIVDKQKCDVRATVSTKAS